MFLLAVVVWAPANGAVDSGIPARLLGPWQLERGEEIVLIEADRMVIWRQGQVRAVGLLGYEKECLTVRNSGLVERWGAVVEGDRLDLEQTNKVMVFRRLDAVPDAVRLDPMPLGSTTSLSPERVSAIQRDLADRLRKDQEAIKSKALKQEEVDGIVAENIRHLRSLVQEVGWIDTTRFGSKTSYGAVILAKHGGDLRLLLAALPFIERDFKKAGDDAQAFAIVYDAVQLDLGRKQRFGTQIRGVGEGKPFVVPLEDPGHVDERRKEIGLPPLAEYLSVAGKVLQMEISMPPADEKRGACQARPDPSSQR
jgi:hypothetical protein